MNKYKLLYVSIALPPKSDSECIQSGRYLKYLDKLNEWEITAITSESPTLNMPVDNSLSDMVKTVRKLEIKIYENRVINKILRIINPKILEKPDSKWSFHWGWKNVVRNVNKPHLIYSRSFPLSSSIMALKLKQNYNVPWVMHLSDPWVESPLLPKSITNSAYHSKMEDKCFKQANLISFTTQETLEIYSEKYPRHRDKFFVSPNVYDPEQVFKGKALNRVLSGKIRIIYTGGLANTRDAELVLKAVSKVESIVENFGDKVEIIFAGDRDRRNIKIFNNYKNLKSVKHLGLITQSEAVELQKTANIFLIIDSKIEDLKKNMFLPSKILDYIGNKIFMVAITAIGSPTEKLVTMLGGVSFQFSEINKLANWLVTLVKGEQNIQVNFEVPQYYSAEYQAKVLNDKLIEQIV